MRWKRDHAVFLSIAKVRKGGFSSNAWECGTHVVPPCSRGFGESRESAESARGQLSPKTNLPREELHRIGKGKRSPVFANVSEFNFWLSTAEVDRPSKSPRFQPAC